MDQTPFQLHITNDPMFAENAYTIYRRPGGPCWVVDPGLPPQAEQIVAFVREQRLDLEAVLLTHAHGDHIAGVDEVRKELGPVPLYLAQPEWAMLGDPALNLSANIGLPLIVADDGLRDLKDGDVLELDGGAWQVLDTSGHSPGGRSFYCAEEGLVIVGDALFAGSVGRVDFPNSNGEDLMANIRSRLMTLPDETRVFSGHGPQTTIGTERTTNPFILHGF